MSTPDGGIFYLRFRAFLLKPLHIGLRPSSVATRQSTSKLDSTLAASSFVVSYNSKSYLKTRAKIVKFAVLCVTLPVYFQHFKNMSKDNNERHYGFKHIQPEYSWMTPGWIEEW